MKYLCGVRETFGDGTPALKLGTNRPLVLVRDSLPQHTRDEIWNWLREASARWSGVCNWQARRISDITDAGANDYINLVTTTDLGSNGVLADQMLPYTGGRVLRMRLNNRIQWKATDGPMSSGTVDPIRTLAHEIGHFMGHSHWPTGAPPELMEPWINDSITVPQPTEGKVSAGWFGAPVPIPLPPSDVAGVRRWLGNLYRDLLRREAGTTEVDAWVPLAHDRLRVVLGFLSSNEFHKRAVTEWYEAFLRRAPDGSGLDAFVASLDGGIPWINALATMLTSAEYYNRE